MITDLMMPEETGEIFIRQIRQQTPDFPVLMITGFAQDPAVHRLQRDFPDLRILTKPVVNFDLKQAIGILLRPEPKVG